MENLLCIIVGIGWFCVIVFIIKSEIKNNKALNYYNECGEEWGASGI